MPRCAPQCARMHHHPNLPTADEVETSPRREPKGAHAKVAQFLIIDGRCLPGLIAVMVEPIGVFAETIQLIDILDGHDRVTLVGPLACHVDELAERGAGRELRWIGDAQIGLAYRTKRLCDGALVRGIGGPEIVPDKLMASVVRGDAILIDVPSRQGGTGSIADDPERSAHLPVRAFPYGAKEPPGVRHHNDLGHTAHQSAHLLHGCQGTMLVETGHRIIYDNNLVSEVGILLQG